MRVIIDTNILISYLLTPDQESAVSKVMQAAFSQAFTILVPTDLVQEVLHTIKKKKHLLMRIGLENAQELVDTLFEIAETLPPMLDVAPAVTRDPKDDYLIAYALMGEADYIVMGDNDLLTLGSLGDIEFVSPQRLVELLLRSKDEDAGTNIG